MSFWAVVRRTIAVLLLVVWVTQILGVAVFAVPDRFDGMESVFLSLLTIAIGFVPIAIVLYVFRDHSHSPSPSRVPAAAHASMPSPSPGAPSILLEPLSERELEILALVARGRSNKEIAAELVVSLATVKTHLNNAYRKLGASSRTEAVAIARDQGLL